MAIRPGHPFKRIFDGKVGTEWKVFVWCFFIAAILWLLTSLNEFYTSTIQADVHYLNKPKDEVFIRPLPEQLNVSVNAKGWDLMGFNLYRSAPDIYVNLTDYQNQSFILSRRLRSSLLGQISKGININEILPDTISLLRDRRITKSVPVNLNYQVKPAEGYELGGEVNYSPDSIRISGPETLLKNINSVETKKVGKTGLKEPVSIKVQIQKPASSITFSSNTVEVQIPVYQLTEQVVEVPVQMVNMPPDKNIRLIPQRVQIVYQTTLNNFSRLDSSLFEAIVDASEIDTASPRPLRIQILSQPKFTYNLRLKDEYVNFIIDKE